MGSGAARALAQANAAAVAAEASVGESAGVAGQVALQHAAVLHEASSGDDHAALAADPHAVPGGRFQSPHERADGREEGEADAAQSNEHVCRACVEPCLPGAWGHAKGFDAEYRAAFVYDQALNLALELCAHAFALAGVLEVIEELEAALALGDVAMTARRGLGDLGVHWQGFVARVVEEEILVGIGGLHRRKSATELQAEALQPVQRLDALVAEGTQGVVGDGALHLLGEVVEHRVGIVVAARLLLLSGAAACVVDAAAHRGRSPATEVIEDEYVGPPLPSLQGAAGSRAPEAHDDEIGTLVPFDGLGIADDDGLADRRVPAGIRGVGHSLSFRRSAVGLLLGCCWVVAGLLLGCAPLFR